MNELTLYHEAFRDYPHRERRYLFEGSGLSLFVWINPENELTSFQVENRRDYYLRFSFAGRRFSTVVRKDGLSPDDTDLHELCRKAGQCTSKDFDELFGVIGRIAAQGKETGYHLNDREIARLREIAVWDYSDDAIDTDVRSMRDKTIDINRRLSTRDNPRRPL